MAFVGHSAEQEFGTSFSVRSRERATCGDKAYHSGSDRAASHNGQSDGGHETSVRPEAASTSGADKTCCCTAATECSASLCRTTSPRRTTTKLCRSEIRNQFASVGRVEPTDSVVQ